MTELSPASLEVWSQYCSIVEEYGPPRLALAAALRETINQCQNGQGVIYSHEIFAIAAELEVQTVPQISEEENERRFKECLRIIQNTTHEDLVELMGENFLEEFRRASQR
jgi:hypothetical protein